MLTPASSNTREKGKYEHMFFTCQIVAQSNCVFRKEKRPKLSNANKEQYNSFDLLCSSFHQLFQFLEIQSFFECAMKIASSKNIKSCRSPVLFLFKEVLARLARFLELPNSRKKFSNEDESLEWKTDDLIFLTSFFHLLFKAQCNPFFIVDSWFAEDFQMLLRVRGWKEVLNH